MDYLHRHPHCYRNWNCSGSNGRCGVERLHNLLTVAHVEGPPHRWLLYHSFLHDLSLPLQCIYPKGATTERIRKDYSIG